MTVDVATPRIAFEGNGTTTTFPFPFPIVESTDLLISLDEILQIEYSTYTIQNLTGVGGEIEFTDAPATGVAVSIVRRTTMSQQVDYITGDPFEAETHEWNLDKITYILQELRTGLIEGGPISFDLSVEQAEFLLTVLNSGGTDAALPMWTDAEFAGVYAARVDLEANLPADESLTSQPEGYIWIGI